MKKSKLIRKIKFNLKKNKAKWNRRTNLKTKLSLNEMI